MAVSPLARPFPAMAGIEGVRLATGAAGIRYAERQDLVLAGFAPGTRVAGVFTRNRCPGAPIDWCRAALPGSGARGQVVNSGNAHVFTGGARLAAPPAPPGGAAATT